MTDTPTSAELLTAAADRLEQLITEAVIDGPWEYRDRSDDPETYPWTVYAPVQKYSAGTGFSPGTARYIAAMSPTVGRSLVALLRGMAFWYFGRGPEWPLGTDSLQALARAILGETS